MKVILVKSPKFLGGILRMIFGIKIQNVYKNNLSAHQRDYFLMSMGYSRKAFAYLNY